MDKKTIGDIKQVQKRASGGATAILLGTEWVLTYRKVSGKKILRGSACSNDDVTRSMTSLNTVTRNK